MCFVPDGRAVPPAFSVAYLFHSQELPSCEVMNFQLLLYSKCTQPHNIHHELYVRTSGRHGLVYSSRPLPSLWLGLSLHVIEEGRAASKSLIKNLAIFYLFPSKEFLPISFKIRLLETSPQKLKDQRRKQLGADKLVTTQI